MSEDDEIVCDECGWPICSSCGCCCNSGCIRCSCPTVKKDEEEGGDNGCKS